MAGSGFFADILDGEVYKYYSDGEWKKSASGKSVAIINPTTRKTQYKVQGDSNYILVSWDSSILLAFLLLDLFKKCKFFASIFAYKTSYPLFFCNSLFTRRGQQGHGDSKNRAKIMG